MIVLIRDFFYIVEGVYVMYSVEEVFVLEKEIDGIFFIVGGLVVY